jgi:SulP family sulfate permease
LTSLRGRLPKLRTLPARLDFHKENLKADGLAGVVGAVGSVADGMAAGILAGINPINGLYASMVGPLVGGFLAGSAFMTIVPTSAMALTAGDELRTHPGGDPLQTLLLLTILVGAFQVAAGLLRLGGLTRFVSRSVMVGFMTGLAVLIILGQLGNFTGFDSDESGKLAQAVDLLRNLDEIDPQTLAVGTLTLLLAVVLPRTPLKASGTVAALVASSVTMYLLGWDNVAVVSDLADIPRSLPVPELPSLSGFSLNLVTAALAIGAIGLVQGSGVSQNFPNPGGAYSDPSRDFSAQGVANVAAGCFQGMPVGGSVGQTALNVSAGAKSRWANIFAGLCLALIIVVFSGLVGYIAMPALAALLMLAGYKIIDAPEAVSIGMVGWAPRIVVALTFVATLTLPIQFAVALGVVASALLYLFASSTDIDIVERVRLADGGYEEREAPKTLPSHAVTTLDVYGSLYFAGARTFEQELPSPIGAHGSVVVLRLRGRTKVGATFVDVLARYAQLLGAAGGRLYLSGVSAHVQEQLVRSGKLTKAAQVEIYPATARIDESSLAAQAAAEEWLVVHGDDQEPVPATTETGTSA